MIVLDTNVISALMGQVPDPVVVAWLDIQPADAIWTTSVCVFEIRFGLNILPSGKRQRALQTAFECTLDQDLDGRVLDFDGTAALESARIAAKLRTGGQTVEIRDVQIAGIVAARRCTLATRNTKHFIDTGVPIVNPWDHEE